MNTKRYILLLLSLSFVVIIAGTLFTNANLGQSKMQSASKEDPGKTVISLDEETRQDMSVPSWHDLKTIFCSGERL